MDGWMDSHSNYSADQRVVQLINIKISSKFFDSQVLVCSILLSIENALTFLTINEL